MMTHYITPFTVKYIEKTVENQREQKHAKASSNKVKATQDGLLALASS